jgi:hypothetical protein
MAGIIFTQIFVAILLLSSGWAIRYKKAYWLISGFSTRPKSEQQELIDNRSPQRTGTLFIATAIGMLLLLPLSFTAFKYAMEVQFGFMLVFLMGGLIYLSKYDVPHKRKRNFIISTSLLVVVIGIIGSLSFLGYQDYELTVRDDSFEITGMYGDEWRLEDIHKIKLMEEMPAVLSKQNGFGTSTIAKGSFKVSDYGSSLLFIHKGSSPILYIEVGKKKIFINSENAQETLNWYEKLNEKTGL